jgi:predicted neutral ceramidase superfamily lipid hydrolase
VFYGRYSTLFDGADVIFRPRHSVHGLRATLKTPLFCFMAISWAMPHIFGVSALFLGSMTLGWTTQIFWHFRVLWLFFWHFHTILGSRRDFYCAWHTIWGATLKTSHFCVYLHFVAYSTLFWGHGSISRTLDTRYTFEGRHLVNDLRATLKTPHFAFYGYFMGYST